MISGVIAKLNSDNPDHQQTMKLIAQISSHPALEVGKLVGQRSLPITIDSAGNQESEEITRWITSLEGVGFVDVVFVHMEDEDVSVKPVRKPRNSRAPT